MTAFPSPPFAAAPTAINRHREASAVDVPTTTGPASASPPPGEEGSRSIAAVERAMDVLLYFGRSGQPDLGVTEIATALGLTKAAVHRILTALRSRELITVDPTSRRYALGHAAVALGRTYLARTDVRAIAAGELRRLVSETGETATLSLRRDDTRIYVDQVVSEQELRMEVTLGAPQPLHAGAASKTFLAFSEPDEIDGYLARHPLAAVTEATVTDPAELRRDLHLIRVRGYATSLGERQPGSACGAAPVFDHAGRVVAVIAVAGPAARFRPDVPEFVAALRGAAGRLSAQLGYGTP